MKRKMNEYDELKREIDSDENNNYKPIVSLKKGFELRKKIFLIEPLQFFLFL